MNFIPKTDNDEVPIFNLPKNDYSNQSLAKWIKDAGIKDKVVTFHVARHTSATLLLSSGTPLAAIQKQLGHTKAATTEIYADLLDKSQRNAVKAFDKRFGKKGGKK
jgi:integrase